MRHKFGVLDGLRGIAALAVMIFHRREWFGGNSVFGHAYLAVDFFFMLSGFVIAHAYQQRLTAPGSFGPFLRNRVLRLHPMLMAGAVLALLVAIMEQRSGKPTLLEWPALTFLASLAPLPALWTSAQSAFPWNPSTWSLFWELVVNIIFAAGACRLRDGPMTFLVLACAVVIVAFGFAENGLLNDVSILLGLPRVCASFFLGVLLFRWYQRRPRREHGGGGWCAAALLLSFSLVAFHGKATWFYDPLIVFGLYPPLIVVAANAVPVLPRLAALSGALSYPIYILHAPALKAVAGVLRAVHLGSAEPGLAEAVVRLALTVAVAFLALRLYDEPVRAWLHRRYGSRRRRRPLENDVA